MGLYLNLLTLFTKVVNQRQVEFLRRKVKKLKQNKNVTRFDAFYDDRAGVCVGELAFRLQPSLTAIRDKP